MKVAPNPGYATFRRKLLGVSSSPWKGLLFRAVPLQFARVNKLLDGKGSLHHGGRWCAAGTFPANNLSTTPEAAYAESNANFTYYNFALSNVQPRVIVGLRAHFTKVLDLVRADAQRTSSKLGLARLLAEDWHKLNSAGQESVSQAFGRAVHDSGAEALLVPSARVVGGTNLVYFPESLESEATVEVLGAEDLDKWLKK